MNKTDVLTIVKALTPDTVADEIVKMWDSFKLARASWEAEMIEIRAYQFATSTRTTEAGQPGFKNSTTIPKLSQIAMNLRANYYAHLFGNPNWIQFQPADTTSAQVRNRNIVEAYARTKARRKDYEGVISSCIDDWLYAGACFAQQRYVTEYVMGDDGTKKVSYQGPILEKIDLQDMVFDITASDFKTARKIKRSVFTLGDLARMVEQDPNSPFTKDMLENIRTTRRAIRSMGVLTSTSGVNWKSIGISRDGFGEMMDYVNSELVEVHEFYGSMYSVETGEFKNNHKITVVDRRLVIEDKPITAPNGSHYIYYATPETRPDNLMGMSMLARLVGMQYKLDKLENMRADIFDRIANPTTVEIGDVQFYGTRGAPGGRYVVDEGGDVKYLVPDTLILNADFQIAKVMEIMEDMAGSPRNATGFRTPGEKTKFEVQVLDNGSNRIFRDRAKNFERTFIEPILNDMIQLARVNMGEVDLVSSTNKDYNTEEFLEISKDDLAVSGQLRARGSTLFAEKANALQNITSLMAAPVSQLINQHISRIALAKALEELGDFKEFAIILQDIGIQEDQRSKRLADQSMNETQATQVVAAMPEAEDDITNADQGDSQEGQ